MQRRKTPFYKAQGFIIDLFLTVNLYRGADISEEDCIPAGLKNGIVFFPLSVKVEPVCQSCGCLTAETGLSLSVWEMGRKIER